MTNSAPRVLIVSNNPLSLTNNNGKTIASFFKTYPKDQVRQLYFSSEGYEDIEIDSYFQISDRQMLTNFLGQQQQVDQSEEAEVDSETSSTAIPADQLYNKPNQIQESQVPVNDFTRLGREIIWKNRWYNGDLGDWLAEFAPEIIFFVAGDSGFAYDIVEAIQEVYQSKLVVYITDDYILKRRTANPFWWTRRNMIYRKMKRCIKAADLYITISKNMQETYHALFGKESILAINMTEPLKISNFEPEERSYLKLIYTGGLHYNRDKVLADIGQAIAQINRKKGEQWAKLFIYSNQIPDAKTLESLSFEGASEFGGSLNPDELKIALNDSDILVHVESFDRRSAESTRLSVSTKIPEYLSLSKPILAVGPAQVASIDLLSQVSLTITDKRLIESSLETFLANKDLLEAGAQKAESLFEEITQTNQQAGMEKIVEALENISSK